MPHHRGVFCGVFSQLRSLRGDVSLQANRMMPQSMLLMGASAALLSERCLRGDAVVLLQANERVPQRYG